MDCTYCRKKISKNQSFKRSRRRIGRKQKFIPLIEHEECFNRRKGVTTRRKKNIQNPIVNGHHM